MYVGVKESNWTFVTSAGVSAGFEYVAASSGYVTLLSPFGHEFDFNYVSLSGSLSLGSPINSNLSTSGMPSKGQIWMLYRSMHDLEADDFTGFYSVEEASIGSIAGYSVTGLVFGVPNVVMGPAYYALKRLGVLERFGIKQGATAMLAMRGPNLGYQLSIGISSGTGYMWVGEERPEWIDYFEAMPVGHEEPALPYQIAQPEGGFWSFPMNTLFDFDKAVIKPEGIAILMPVAVLILNSNARAVLIDGHTDSIGCEAYNERLSKRRAEAVKRFLRPFLPATKLITQAWGETRPVASNRTKVGRGLNRRVEITLHRD
ncbi:OmpA family protein [Sphingomonas sp.]|uniref:OmpA family protein n=1 Tax=Sphingomonas sp. TaxID=28214 RepID=UPI003CC639C7